MTASTPLATKSQVRSNPPRRSTARIAATAMIQTSEIGISTFQPKAMNWS